MHFSRAFSRSSSSWRLGVLGLPPAALAVLQVPRGLGMPTHLLEILALAEEPLALSQPADHLLPGMPTSLRRRVLPVPSCASEHANRWIRSRSPGQRHQRSSKASLPRSEFSKRDFGGSGMLYRSHALPTQILNTSRVSR